MKLFVNSDAHRLSDIPEPQNELELPECSAEALIDYIKTVKEFKCCFFAEFDYNIEYYTKIRMVLYIMETKRKRQPLPYSASLLQLCLYGLLSWAATSIKTDGIK